MEDNEVIVEVCNNHYIIAKEDNYWYIVNSNNLDCLFFYFDPNKNFKTKENAIKYLKGCLLKYGRSLVKELTK